MLTATLLESFNDVEPDDGDSLCLPSVAMSPTSDPQRAIVPSSSSLGAITGPDSNAQSGVSLVGEGEFGSDTLNDVIETTEGPRVTGMTPLPGSLFSETTTEIRIGFDRPVDPLSVNRQTVLLEASGGDGTFDDGNERRIAPATVSVIGDTQARMDLTGIVLADDVYRVTLVGDVERISGFDAELLAMKGSRELLPPPDLYQKIRADLIAIREAYPGMTSIRPSLPWVPGELLVGLTPEAMEQFNNDEYHGLDELNAQYGPVEMTSLGFNAVKLRFEQQYNPDYLWPLYAAADGVRYAQPNYIYGDGDDITASGTRYTFSMGWGDCPSGCIDRHYWVFDVQGDSANLVFERGTPLRGPIAPAVVTDLNGHVLDGEGDFASPLRVDEFPSGDGLQGGDFVAAFHVQTTPTIHVGEHVLRPDTPDQVIPIYVHGDDAVQGVVFNVQIADGYPDVPGSTHDGPNITGVDLIGPGTIFASVPNTGHSFIERRDQIEVVGTSTSSGTVLAEGLLAKVTIDTTGLDADDGPWELNLAGTINGDTNFQSPAGQIIPQIENGVIRMAPANPWHNAARPADVNGDTFVSPTDVLLVINRLNAVGSGTLPRESTHSPAEMPFVDTNNDGMLSPVDVLLAINELNGSVGDSSQSAGEGDAPTNVAGLVPQQDATEFGIASLNQTSSCAPAVSLHGTEPPATRRTDCRSDATKTSQPALWSDDADYRWLESDLEGSLSDVAPDVLSVWSR